MHNQNPAWRKPVLLLLIAISIVICYTKLTDEVYILKHSIPNVVYFYEENMDHINSLVNIQKKYEHKGIDGYWSIGQKSDGSLYVLGVSPQSWDSVSLFNQEERRQIEYIFDQSYNDISIVFFNSRGEIAVKYLGRYYLKIMFLPDDELYQYWIEDDWLVQYFEPISDGWYVILLDGRPCIA